MDALDDFAFASMNPYILWTFTPLNTLGSLNDIQPKVQGVVQLLACVI